MNIQRIIEAVKREAERQNVEADVASHSDHPDVALLYVRLEQRPPVTLGIHVSEEMKLKDRPGG